MDKIIKQKADFIEKASGCDYNRLWKCTHKNQKDRKCTEICKYYQNSYELEETIKN
jgi:hypothetical protein